MSDEKWLDVKIDKLFTKMSSRICCKHKRRIWS